MEVEPTFLPPFSTPALGVHDHRRPRLESAHPPEMGAASDTGAGHHLRHRESVLRFSELARPSGTGPLSSSQTLPYWKAIRHRWVLRHWRPEPLSDITLTATRQRRLVLIPAAVLLSISPFSQSSAGVPLTSGTSSAGRRHLMHCPRRSSGGVVCLEEYREGTNHQ